MPGPTRLQASGGQARQTVLAPPPLVLIPRPRIQIAAAATVRLALDAWSRRDSDLLLLVVASGTAAIGVLIPNPRIPRVVLGTPDSPCRATGTIRYTSLLPGASLFICAA